MGRLKCLFGLSLMTMVFMGCSGIRGMDSGMNTSAQPPADLAIDASSVVRPEFAPSETSSAVIPTIDFYSGTGEFNVQFPIMDGRQSSYHSIQELSRVREVSGEPTICYSIFVRGYGAHWEVEYCNYSDEIINQNSIEDILDMKRDEAKKEARGKITSEREIFYNSHPGREIVADSARRDARVYDGKYYARLYLIENRIYRVDAYVHNQNVGNTMSTIEPYLNSFYVED